MLGLHLARPAAVSMSEARMDTQSQRNVSSPAHSPLLLVPLQSLAAGSLLVLLLLLNVNWLVSKPAERSLHMQLSGPDGGIGAVVSDLIGQGQSHGLVT